MLESADVTYRGRRIDLAPYLEGFPYVGFDALPEANLLLYFHDLPDRRLLKVQPLDRPFDPALGRAPGEHDWNRRSFWARRYHRATDAVLFVGDESNDEVLNVFSLSLTTGTIERLTDVPYVHGFGLSPDERWLAYVARFADGPRMRAELRLRDMSTGEDRVAVRDTPAHRFTWGQPLWRGTSHILLEVNLDEDRNRSNLVWVDLADPALAPLLDTSPPRSVLGVLDDWLDSRTCLYVSNETGYMQLYRLNVDDGSSEQITDEPYDYRSWRTVRVDGRLLVATVGDRPRDSPIRVFDPATGETVWEHLADGALHLMAAKTDRLHFDATSLGEKWAMWRLELSEGPRWERVGTMPPAVARATSHARVERIEYETFDGRRIHAFLLVPNDLPPVGQRQAFVVAFYGGANAFSQNLQILAQAGFVVLSPAVRGSFGFGREWYGLIDKDLGGNEIVDLIYGARYLAERFEIAPRQIGAFGGSHGGYATARALTLPAEVNGRSEAFDWGFGWAHAGFFDITTFWRDCNIPDWVTQKAGDPRTEREKLLDRSPLTHADRLNASLYLTHGDRDNRVPVNESRIFAERLAALGKRFRYDEFEGHGHALKGIAAQRRLWQGLLTFLEAETAAR